MVTDHCNKTLELDNIISNFQESEQRKAKDMEFNRTYFALRRTLLPEEQEMLDKLYSMSDEYATELAEEVYSCCINTLEK